MAARSKSKGLAEDVANARTPPVKARPPVATFLAELLAEAEAAQDRLEFASSLGRQAKAEPAETSPPASPSRRTRRPRPTE